MSHHNTPISKNKTMKILGYKIVANSPGSENANPNSNINNLASPGADMPVYITLPAVIDNIDPITHLNQGLKKRLAKEIQHNEAKKLKTYLQPHQLLDAQMRAMHAQASNSPPQENNNGDAIIHQPTTPSRRDIGQEL